MSVEQLQAQLEEAREANDQHGARNALLETHLLEANTKVHYLEAELDKWRSKLKRTQNESDELARVREENAQLQAELELKKSTVQNEAELGERGRLVANLKDVQVEIAVIVEELVRLELAMPGELALDGTPGLRIKLLGILSNYGRLVEQEQTSQDAIEQMHRLAQEKAEVSSELLSLKKLLTKRFGVPEGGDVSDIVNLLDQIQLQLREADKMRNLSNKVLDEFGVSNKFLGDAIGSSIDGTVTPIETMEAQSAALREAQGQLYKLRQDLDEWAKAKPELVLWDQAKTVAGLVCQEFASQHISGLQGADISPGDVIKTQSVELRRCLSELGEMERVVRELKTELDLSKKQLLTKEHQVQEACAEAKHASQQTKELEKAKELLLSTDPGAAVVPYTEFAALEDHLKKIERFSLQTQSEFHQVPEMQRALSLSSQDHLSPVETQQATNSALGSALAELAEAQQQLSKLTLQLAELDKIKQSLDKAESRLKAPVEQGQAERVVPYYEVAALEAEMENLRNLKHKTVAKFRDTNQHLKQRCGLGEEELSVLEVFEAQNQCAAEGLGHLGELNDLRGEMESLKITASLAGGNPNELGQLIEELQQRNQNLEEQLQGMREKQMELQDGLKRAEQAAADADLTSRQEMTAQRVEMSAGHANQVQLLEADIRQHQANNKELENMLKNAKNNQHQANELLDATLADAELAQRKVDDALDKEKEVGEALKELEASSTRTMTKASVSMLLKIMREWQFGGAAECVRSWLKNRSMAQYYKVVFRLTRQLWHKMLALSAAHAITQWRIQAKAATNITSGSNKSRREALRMLSWCIGRLLARNVFLAERGWVENMQCFKLYTLAVQHGLTFCTGIIERWDGEVLASTLGNMRKNLAIHLLREELSLEIKVSLEKYQQLLVAKARSESQLKRQKRELMGTVGELRSAMEDMVGKDATALIEEQIQSKGPLLAKVQELEDQADEAKVAMEELANMRKQLADRERQIELLESNFADLAKRHEITSGQTDAEHELVVQKLDKFKRLNAELASEVEKYKAAQDKGKIQAQETTKEEVERVRRKLSEWSTKLETKVQEGEDMIRELKIEIGRQRIEMEQTQAKFSQELSNSKAMKKECDILQQHRDEAVRSLSESETRNHQLKEDRHRIRSELQETSKALSELQSKQSSHRAEHQSTLQALTLLVQTKINEIQKDYNSANPSATCPGGLGKLAPPPPALLLQEQQTDLTCMMLSNELIMIEEQILLSDSWGQDEHSSLPSGFGAVPLWLQQLHLQKKLLLQNDKSQLNQLEASLDATNFENLLVSTGNGTDLSLALAHAQQRATVLTGQLLHLHKISCLYFQDCLRAKASQVLQLEKTVEFEKAARKDVVTELAQQHETVANLMELGPEWLGGASHHQASHTKLQSALDQATADKQLYQAALEQAEEQLLTLKGGAVSNKCNSPDVTAMTAQSVRDGLSALGMSILKEGASFSMT